VVPRRIKRKLSLTNETGDDEQAQASSGPTRRNTDEESAKPTPASNCTATRPSPADSGSTGPKRSDTDEPIRVTVRIQNSEDAILVPCDQLDQTVEWLMAEAASRLEEILETSVSLGIFRQRTSGFLTFLVVVRRTQVVIKRLKTSEGIALSKRDKVSAVLKDMDTVVAVV